MKKKPEEKERKLINNAPPKTVEEYSEDYWEVSANTDGQVVIGHDSCDEPGQMDAISMSPPMARCLSRAISEAASMAERLGMQYDAEKEE
jgi:hypothetical protein